MSFDKVIRGYVNFINSSWDSVMPLLKSREYTDDESSINDWLQVNWELLVERKVLDFQDYLEVYSSGADFFEGSSRIIDKDAKETYRIHFESIEDSSFYDVLNEITFKSSKLYFLEFVSMKEGFYSRLPCFDHVLVYDENDIERVLSLDSIRFVLKRIPGKH